MTMHARHQRTPWLLQALPWTVVLMAVISSFWLTGCKPITQDPSITMSNPTLAFTFTDLDKHSSRLRVLMNGKRPDIEGLSEVNIDVRDALVCDSDGGCLSTKVQSQVINLLDLVNGNSITLFDIYLVGEDLAEIRLVLGHANELVIENVPIPLTIPSGSATGLKLKGGFPLEIGQLTAVLISFDSAESLVMKNNNDWLLKPVFRIESVEVAPQAAVTGVAVPGAYVTISSGPDGASVDIPAGAVPEPTLIWIDEWRSDELASLWTFGPEGYVFSKNVTVTIPSQRELLPVGYQNTPITLFQDDIPVATAENISSSTFSTSTDHFSIFDRRPKQPSPT